MYDIARIKRLLKSVWLHRVLPILLVALCLAGMVLTLLGRFDLGLGLWFFALAAGAVLVYLRHTLEKKLRDLEEEEAQG